MLKPRRGSYGGVETRVLEVAGDGPPLILLHGYSDSADTFRPLLRELASRGRHAIAVDLPGFGQAGPPERGPLLPALTDFTTAVLKDRGVPAVLAGHSMGGAVTLRVAATAPELLRAAVPMDPAGLGFHDRLHTIGQTVNRLVPILRVMMRPPYPPLLLQAGARLFYKHRVMRGSAVDAELARRFAVHLRTSQDLRRIGKLGRQLHAELDEDWVDLAAIPVPVLAIWGRQDPLCLVEGGQRILDVVRHAHLITIDRCGHMPHLQHPAIVADLLSRPLPDQSASMIEIDPRALRALPADAPVVDGLLRQAEVPGQLLYRDEGFEAQGREDVVDVQDQ